MNRINATILAFATVILFIGCAPTGLVSDSELLNKEIENSESQVKEGYRFGDGDVLNINVFGEQELSGKYTLDASGYVSFPLIGKIKLINLTNYEAEALLESKLRKGYLKFPDVLIEVDSFRPFSILGEVGAPGNYEYSQGLTVADAVAKGGGFTFRAHKDNFEVLRRSQDGWTKKELSVSEELQPGDIVYVRERLF